VLHIIRSFNSKIRSFCQLINLLDYKFDAVVLSEIWAYNITYYKNILPGYSLYYKLPTDTKVGGVGIFVKDCYCVHELASFSISSTESCKVENLWLEITRFGNKVILGGIYRHPNHNILDFTSKFEDELNKILSQRIPCVVAGDFNIDLLKFDNHTATKDFLHSLLTNNFTPTVLLPSRITSKSTSLIDHIYINKGQKNNSAWFDSHIKSGNLLTDISDHLPNFTLILNNPTDDIKLRPKVRIFFPKTT